MEEGNSILKELFIRAIKDHNTYASAPDDYLDWSLEIVDKKGAERTANLSIYPRKSTGEIMLNRVYSIHAVDTDNIWKYGIELLVRTGLRSISIKPISHAQFEWNNDGSDKAAVKQYPLTPQEAFKKK